MWFNPVEWGSKSRVKAEYRTVHWFSYSRDLSKNNSHVMPMTETRSEGDRPDWEVQRASIHNFVGKMVSPRKLSRTTRSQRRVSERRQNHVWIADRIDLRKRWRAVKCKIGSNWYPEKCYIFDSYPRAEKGFGWASHPAHLDPYCAHLYLGWS